MENIKRNYEQSENREECQYGLVMNSCRECLFEVLCHLQKWKKQSM